MTDEEKEVLSLVHFLRMEAHWGIQWARDYAFFGGRWPSSDAEWRQTGHGAPWDANVEMAKFHLKLAKKITKELEKRS